MRIADAKGVTAKSEATAKLEYQTGISESSLKAICSSPSRSYPEMEENKQPAQNGGNPKLGVVRSCIKTCQKPKKAK